MRNRYVHRLDVQPYEWTVYVFGSREAWSAFVARRGQFGGAKYLLHEACGSAGITTLNTNVHEAYVGVFDSRPGTLGHEMTHVAIEILSAADVRYSRNNNEALAYLVGHLIDRSSKGVCHE